MSLYIGLMSGTSADAIDAAIIDTANNTLNVLAAETYPLTDQTRNAIIKLYEPGENEIDQLGELDSIVGLALANTVNTLLKKNLLTPSDITAIGSHGQTIRHRPNFPSGHSFTLQIGDPNIIAQKTGITTIADFRRRDMAAGGQGAPLTPAFHAYAFSSKKTNRAILNIGGIANLTCLPVDGPVIGFDTGPGNGLMDAWVWHHKQVEYDLDGQWAKEGVVSQALLKQLMSNSYIHSPPPKSTGRESFSLSWLLKELEKHPHLSEVDIQATLLEFTVQSIAHHIERFCLSGTEIYLCGGGSHNATLYERLDALLPNYTIDTTSALGIPPDDVEAITFAWLAMRTWEGLHGNLPGVTGAEQAVILGGIYPA